MVKRSLQKSYRRGLIRLKRALLYQLSYELVQGRFFKANTGPALLLASVAWPLASVVLPLTGRPGMGLAPRLCLRSSSLRESGPCNGKGWRGKSLRGRIWPPAGYPHTKVPW